MTPSGYKFRHKARTGKRGGGLGIMYRDDIRLDMDSSIKAKSYERVHVTLTVGESSVHIIIIYHLHPTKKSNVKSSDFFAEFATVIDELSSISDEVIIAGDYIIHWDTPTETETMVVTREGQNILGNQWMIPMLSDHFVVQADL